MQQKATRPIKVGETVQIEARCDGLAEVLAVRGERVRVRMLNDDGKPTGEVSSVPRCRVTPCPSPAAIRQTCQEIQAGWTACEERSRRDGHKHEGRVDLSDAVYRWAPLSHGGFYAA